MSGQVSNHWHFILNRQRRSARGQAIAEGAAMMPVIVGLSLFMVILLFFIGTTFYYWIQLNSLATQLASYLSTQVKSDQTALTATQKSDLITKANKLLTILNLPTVATGSESGGSGGGAMALAADLSGNPALTVTLTLTGIKTFGGVIPSIPIVGHGVSLAPLFEPKFKHFAGVCFTDVGAPNGIHHGVTLYVPCYEVAAFGDWGGVAGKIPSGMSQLGYGGVNSVYDASPRQTFGGVGNTAPGLVD